MSDPDHHAELAEYNSMGLRIQDLELDNEQLRGMLEIERRTSAELHDEIERLSIERDSFQDDLVAAIERNAPLRAEIERLRAELERLRYILAISSPVEVDKPR